MAAPAPTARQTPAGIKLPDGFASKITFDRDPDISIWEKSTKPPGIDTGDPIDTSTHFNLRFRTMAQRALVTLTAGAMTCGYDPACYDQILDMAGINQVITQRFIDGSTIAYWGILKSAEFAELVEGTFPEVTIDITPTNTDDDGVEQGPVSTLVAGT